MTAPGSAPEPSPRARRARPGQKTAPGRWSLRAAALAASLASSGAAAQLGNVSSTRLEEMMRAGAVVIDIRTPDEWRETGVIEGSHRLTFFDRWGRYDSRAWLAELAKVAEPDDEVVLVCQAGVRTAVVGRYLDLGTGYRNVHHLENGISEWLERGKPTVPVP